MDRVARLETENIDGAGTIRFLTLEGHEDPFFVGGILPTDDGWIEGFKTGNSTDHAGQIIPGLTVIVGTVDIEPLEGEILHSHINIAIKGDRQRRLTDIEGGIIDPD